MENFLSELNLLKHRYKVRINTCHGFIASNEEQKVRVKMKHDSFIDIHVLLKDCKSILEYENTRKIIHDRIEAINMMPDSEIKKVNLSSYKELKADFEKLGKLI